MSRQKKYTFIDLFAGCGGLSLGLEQAGFEVVFMNEIVETFASTYLANHSLKQGQYFIGDINELNTCLDKYRDTLKNPDRPITLVCGGPPCQGFSMANRQRIIDDPRNQLYKAYLQFLSEIRPQFFIMENVKGIMSAPLKHVATAERDADDPDQQLGTVLSVILSEFDKLGYKTVYLSLIHI